MTTYRYCEDNGGQFVGEFATKKKFLIALTSRLGLCMDEKEHRSDIGWMKQSSNETCNTFACTISIHNPNRIIHIPKEIRRTPFWELYFRGKFFFEDAIKTQKEVECLVERNKDLEACIERIKQQIEAL